MPIEFAEANSGAGGAKFAVDNITEGVNTLAVPYVKLMNGADASNAPIPGDSTNGLDVDVTRLPAGTLSAGNLVQLDYDTGAGTQNMPMVGVALPASGGAVAGGTATNPIRIDPTGTTTQPVSGTVTANAGTGTFNVQPASSATLFSDRLVSGSLVDSAGNALTVKTTFARPATAGNNALIAAVPGKKIRVLAYRLQASGTVSVKFVDTASPTPADLSMLWEFQAREGAAITAPPGSFEFESGVGLGVQVNLSAAVATSVMVQYVEV